jgi:DNA replication protein DnaC
MTPIEQLRTTLGAFSLTAIDARLEGLLENAAKKEPSYRDFLLEVMNTEADARRKRYLKARLQLAHLPFVKTSELLSTSGQETVLGERISMRSRRVLQPGRIQSVKN